MDQQNQRGNFVAYKNNQKSRYPRAAEDAKRTPDFKGKITDPTNGREFEAALWAGTDKNGNVIFTGKSSDVALNDAAIDKIKAMAGQVDLKALEDGNLKLEPGQILAFTDPKREQRCAETGKNHPHFYGRWNTGDKVLDFSLWATNSKFGQPMLAGGTQVRQPGKKLEDMGNAHMSANDIGGIEQDAEQTEKTASRRGRTRS